MSAMFETNAIHGVWIPTVHAGMTGFFSI